MDTGWKKSKLRAFIKIIAFLLAVVIAGYAGFFTLDTFDNAKTDDITYSRFVYDVFSVREEKDIYKSDAFKRELDGYVNSLADLVGTYGDGSKKSYETLEKNYEAKYAAYKNNLIKNIAYLVNVRKDFPEVLRQLTINVISLEKIAEIDYGIITRTEYGYDEVIYDYDYYHIWTANYPDDRGTFSTSLQKKAEKVGADAILEFESLFFDGVSYSGYYALKINDKAFRHYLNESYLTEIPYDYDHFEEGYITALSELNGRYKNINYIIKSESGKVLTNLSKLDKNWEDNIYNTLRKYEYYTVSDGELFEDDNGNTLFCEEVRFLSDYNNDQTDFVTEYYFVLQPDTEVPATDYYKETTRYDNTVHTTLVNDNSVETTSKINSGDYSKIAEDAKVYIFFNEDAEFASLSLAQIKDGYSFTANLVEGYLIVILALLFVFLLLSVLLMILSGNGKITVRDKVFVDLKIVINGVCFALFAFGFYLLFESCWYHLNHIPFTYFVCAAVCWASMAIIFVDLLMFLSRRIKGKTFVKGFFIVWLVAKVKKKVDNMLYAKGVSKTVKVRTLLLIAVNFVVGAFAWCLTVYDGGSSPFFGILIFAMLFIGDVIVLALGLKFVGSVEKMFSVIEEYKKGNLDETININALPQYLVAPAENLQGVGTGLKKAVDEAVKQEKTKTELITNISHDLKTPLTSIINYVELLKGCDITDETAISYLEVLGEKSDKLKNLIVDLVEASKAATGNVTVEFVEVSLKELLNQLIGEFSEEFDKKRLEVISDMPEEDILVKADSKLLYRVLENLIVNVKKYALENTRVYITLSRKDGKGIISIKNISAAPLNISAEELKGRFVRGEESRTTEGNGLGLSIAENLCIVQGGKLDLEIIGDLFCAFVEMDGIK